MRPHHLASLAPPLLGSAPVCSVRILAEVSFVLSQFTRLTERQTHGHGRFHRADTALHSMSRGKNGFIDSLSSTANQSFIWTQRVV